MFMTFIDHAVVLLLFSKYAIRGESISAVGFHTPYRRWEERW